MKSKCKRITSFLALVLSICMIIGMMAGCSKEEETTNVVQEETAATEEKAEETKEENAEETEEVVLARDIPEEEWLPLVKEGEDATLTVGICQAVGVPDYDTNAFTLYLEEMTGVDIEFVYYPQKGADAVQTLGLQIAAGEELPDIIWNFSGADQYTMFEYGRDGYFYDLTEYFEEYGHYLWKAYDELPESSQKNLFTMGVDPVSGASFSMPYISGTWSTDAYEWMAYINQEWLNTLGLKEPTTVDELYEVLVAFRDQDPNGNGQNDEIPMIGSLNGWRCDITQYIVNAFVNYDSQYLWNATDGELWAPFVTDEYRQAMIFLNKLVSEGLLAEQTFTFPNPEPLRLLYAPEDNVAIVGVMGGIPSLCDGETIFQYTALTPLQDATGSGVGGTYVPKLRMPSYNTFITTDCDNPVLAFKFLDFFNSDGSATFMRFGQEGVDWERSEGFTSLGDPAVVKVLNDAAFSEGNQTWHSQGGCILLTKTNSSITDTPDTTTISGYRTAMTVEGVKKMESAKLPEEQICQLVYTAEENDVVAQVKTLLMQYLDEGLAKFATGVWDPNDDAAWQSFLDEMEMIGLSDYLAVSQAAYDRMNADK